MSSFRRNLAVGASFDTPPPADLNMQIYVTLSLQRELFLPNLRPRRAYPISPRSYIPSSTTVIAIGSCSSIYKLTQQEPKTP